MFCCGFGHEDLDPMDHYQQSMIVEHGDDDQGHELIRRNNLGFVEQLWQLPTRQSTPVVLAPLVVVLVLVLVLVLVVEK